MFTMDVPVVPAQQTPIVLAQAAPVATPQPNYLLTGCMETTPSTIDPKSAEHVVDPVDWLANYLNNNSEKQIVFNLTDIKNITLLQGTTHGKLTAEVDTDGRTIYYYVVDPGYLGNDTATFMAKFKGKYYKIVVDLRVVTSIDNSDSPVSSCPEPTLIKLKPKSVPISYNFN